MSYWREKAQSIIYPALREGLAQGLSGRSLRRHIRNHYIIFDSANLKKFYPGVLLKVGDYYPDNEFLKQMIDLNRKNEINGEVFFFYEGIKKYPDFFKEIYKDRVVFPELLN